MFADPETQELFTVAILSQGEPAVWQAFLDHVQEKESQMWGLEPDRIVFIQTPTVYILGELKEVGVMHLVLKPGAHEIRSINNLYTFLNDGVYHREDEVTPLPGLKRVPALSVVTVDDWTHAMMPIINRTPNEMRGG